MTPTQTTPTHTPARHVISGNRSNRFGNTFTPLKGDLNMKNALTTATLLACTAIVGSAQAATISSLGVDTTTGADWRTAATAKSATYDPDGDNIYGSDGYFVGYSAIGASNTPTELTLENVSSISYISSVTSFSPFFGSDAYANIDNPAAAGEINAGLYYNAGTKFSFTVSENTEFVLAVIVGDGNSDGVNSIAVNQTVGSGGGTATNTGFATVDGVVEYVFFNINAAAGDEFEVVTAVANGNQGISGLGFEVVPEPGSLALLGAGCLMMLKRRRRQS